jgi:hypothetical protein
MKNFTTQYAKDDGYKKFKSIIDNVGTIDLTYNGSNISNVYSGLFNTDSWLDTDRIWHVAPIGVRIYNDTDIEVYIICPICGMVHTHSGTLDNNGNIEIGYRTSHCSQYLCNPNIQKIENNYYIESVTRDSINTAKSEKKNSLANSFQDYK